MTASPVAPWIAAQCAELAQQRSHALLLHGPSGLGQLDLAFALARWWLCETPGPAGGCGQCASCHALDVRTNADLFVLMPETLLLEHGWPLGEKEQADIDEKKRKPSKEIRIDAMRAAIGFSQRTSAAGRGKVVLVYPAQRMNAVTANALLKTLEEPPGSVRFVLASESAHLLLPTIRSRCLGHAMHWPQSEVSIAWLAEQGVDGAAADVFMRATGGRPDDALQLAMAKTAPADWSALPKAVQRGAPGLLAHFAPQQVVDTLQKLCHDLQLQRFGALPRFFLAADLPPAPPIPVLARWSQALADARRTAEHPFNSGLMLEALISQAQNALNSR